ALGAPARAEVTAAQVGADRQALGPVAQCRLDQLHRQRELSVWILATRPAQRAHLLVAEVGQADVVELQIAAAGGVELGDLDPIGDRKSTRLNPSHGSISYAVFCL